MKTIFKKLLIAIIFVVGALAFLSPQEVQSGLPGNTSLENAAERLPSEGYYQENISVGLRSGGFEDGDGDDLGENNGTPGKDDYVEGVEVSIGEGFFFLLLLLVLYVCFRKRKENDCKVRNSFDFPQNNN